MKFYVTKYALTQGILEWDCDEPTPESPSLLMRGWSSAWGEGSQWHRTMDGALETAESMRIKKIASLRKQIAKLEKLTFNQVKLPGLVCKGCSKV